MHIWNPALIDGLSGFFISPQNNFLTLLPCYHPVLYSNQSSPKIASSSCFLALLTLHPLFVSPSAFIS